MISEYDCLITSYFGFDQMSVRDIWVSLLATQQKLWGDQDFVIRGVELQLTDVEDYILETRSSRFSLELDGYTVVYLGSNELMGQVAVTLRLPGLAALNEVSPFLSDCAPAIYSRIYSERYSSWQKETHVSELEEAGIPYDEAAVYVDRRKNRRVPIDNNPGREVEHRGDSGYLEAIGSTMWIGSSFAERTGGDWREMRKYDWCQITEHDNGLVQLDSWPQPFDSDQGEQRERQDVLRRVLFPNSAAT